MAAPLHFKSAGEIAGLLADGSCSSEEVTRAVIERTRAVEDRVQAFTQRNEELALDLVRASDQRRAEGRSLGPLDGVPVSIKDVLASEGERLTCRSRMLFRSG